MACEDSIHQIDRNGVIVRIVPPTGPVPGQIRGGNEVVLLIDVSASMDGLAPVLPNGDGEDLEQKGFNILDLTKQAAHTIVESLDDHDTLCVVPFSIDCKVTIPSRPDISTRRYHSSTDEQCTDMLRPTTHEEQKQELCKENDPEKNSRIFGLG